MWNYFVYSVRFACIHIYKYLARVPCSHLLCPSLPMLSVWGLVGTHTAKTGSEQQLGIVTTASD